LAGSPIINAGVCWLGIVAFEEVVFCGADIKPLAPEEKYLHCPVYPE